MQFNFGALDELVRPLNINLKDPEYHVMLFRKCEDLHLEQDFLIVSIDEQYEAFIKCKPTKTQLLSKISSLRIKASELENMSGSIPKQHTRFEWAFSVDIVDTVLRCLLSNIDLLEITLHGYTGYIPTYLKHIPQWERFRKPELSIESLN